VEQVRRRSGETTRRAVLSARILKTTPLRGPIVPRLQIRLLGTFDVALDGEPVRDFESDSARALVAYLAAEPGRAFSRATLAEMFWPERPEGAAVSNLRHVLTVLRRVLGTRVGEARFLISDRTTVSIESSPEVSVDLIELEHLATTPVDRQGAVQAWERASGSGPERSGMNGS